MSEIFIQKYLGNGVWHTTSHDRYLSILIDGYILPNPNISDRDRWGTGEAPEHYPFARHLGAVSLFCFAKFKALEYEKRYPASHWRAFVPCSSKWNEAVWIELKKERLENYISPEDLLAQWESTNSHGHNIMPMIEAAHTGPIPLAAIKQVITYSKSSGFISELPVP